MVTCTAKEERYVSELSNGNVTIISDNARAAGGSGIEFGPHNFIEAGYAACLTAGTRKICERENVEYESIKVTVALDYSDENKMYIRHKIEIGGVPEDVAADIAAREFGNCKVKNNLLKELVFEPLED